MISRLIFCVPRRGEEHQAWSAMERRIYPRGISPPVLDFQLLSPHSTSVEVILPDVEYIARPILEDRFHAGLCLSLMSLYLRRWMSSCRYWRNSVLLPKLWPRPSCTAWNRRHSFLHLTRVYSRLTLVPLGERFPRNDQNVMHMSIDCSFEEGKTRLQRIVFDWHSSLDSLERLFVGKNRPRSI